MARGKYKRPVKEENSFAAVEVNISTKPERWGEIEENAIDFMNVPSSPAVLLILDVIGAGSDIDTLPARKKAVGRHSSYEVKKVPDSEKGRIIVMKSDTATLALEVEDITVFDNKKKPVAKFFILTLQKICQQALHNGTLTQNRISYPLHELVDIGLYSNEDAARVGFLSCMRALNKLVLSGEYRTKTYRNNTGGLRPFGSFQVVNSQCFVALDNEFDYRSFALFFAIVPSWFWELSNRASILFLHIFFMARQNTQRIAKEGRFNISFNVIHQKLMLPGIKATKSPKTHIKDVIAAVIEEIEEANKKHCMNVEKTEDIGFSLLPCCDETAPIKAYLDNGYLQVSLKGSFAAKLIEIDEERTAKIEKAARIKEKAQIKALSEKTKKGE